MVDVAKFLLEWLGNIVVYAAPPFFASGKILLENAESCVLPRPHISSTIRIIRIHELS